MAPARVCRKAAPSVSTAQTRKITANSPTRRFACRPKTGWPTAIRSWRKRLNCSTARPPRSLAQPMIWSHNAREEDGTARRLGAAIKVFDFARTGRAKLRQERYVIVEEPQKEKAPAGRHV